MGCRCWHRSCRFGAPCRPGLYLPLLRTACYRLVAPFCLGRFDGDHLIYDGRLLVVHKVKRRADAPGRLVTRFADPREPDRVVHGPDEITRLRSLLTAAIRSRSHELALGRELWQ